MTRVKSVTLTTKTNRPSAPTTAASDVVALVTLKTEASSDPEAGGRAKPVDLMVVLDKSGSMQGEKLELCKRTLEFLGGALSSNDRMGLVLFDSTVTTALAMTSMDEPGKALAAATIKRITDGSCTNLSGGLMQGLDNLLKSSRDARVAENKNVVSAVLLLSDGLANEGVTAHDQLLRLVTNQLARFKEANQPVPSVFTFGYGSDADVDLMKKIAESAGGGLFYTILNTEAVPLAFSDVVGGLLAVCAQNLELTVHLASSGDGASDPAKPEFAGPPLCKHPNARGSDGTSWKVSLKDMYAGEERDLLFKLKVPAGTNGFTVRAELTYVDCGLEESVTLEASAQVGRSPGDKPDASVVEDVEVVRQLARVEAVEALEAARAKAEQGDLTGATAAIGATRMRLGAVMAANNIHQEDDCMMTEIMADLKLGEAAMQSEVLWKAEGKSRVAAAASSHAYQRSNRADEMLSAQTDLQKTAGFLSSTSSAYAVPSKTRMMSQAKAAFGLQ